MTDGIGRASAFLASGTVVSRLLGFVKAIALASAIGLVSSKSADAFAVANQLPNTLYAIIAGGVLTAVLVPQIVRAGLAADGGAAYINKLVTLALVVLAGATVVGTALAPLLTLLYGATLSADQRALATAFAFWCLPQIFFYGLYTVLGEVLNARKSFGPSTWAPVVNNVVALAGIALFIWLFGADAEGLRAPSDWSGAMITVIAGTATIGVAAQALILFWFWRRIGIRYRPDFQWRGVGLGTAGRMAGWTFGMILLTTFAGIIETNVVNIASGDDASVAALGNAWLIFMLPHSVITVSIATAYFTRMAEHASHGRIPDLKRDVSSAIRGISLIIVLAGVVLLVCAYPFAAVFTHASFAQTAAFGNVIIAYLLGLLPFCILFVVQRAFYALGDTRTPFFFTLVQTIIVSGLVLVCILLPVEWITSGVALAVSVAGVIQLALAAWLLSRRLDGIEAGRITRSLLVYAGPAIVSAVVGFGLLLAFGGTSEGGFAVSGVAAAVISMAVIGSAMALVYFGILWLVRAPELRAFGEPLLARLRRR